MTNKLKSSTIKLIKSCEVALEVVDEHLFVNTLIHQNDQGTQKQKFILGEDFHLHQGPHGIVLYWGQNIYYLDKEGVLKNILIPTEFSSDFQDIYILSDIFEKKGIFVIYKQPESKNGRGTCFIYKTKTHESITLQTEHSFHSVIISDVQNLDFFLKDTLRGELRISANNRVNKIPIKTITREEKKGDKSYLAVLGQLEFQFSGDFILTYNGGFQQVVYQDNQVTDFQHQYKIQYDQTVLNIIDVNNHVNYRLQLPTDFNLQQVLMSEKGNFFCIFKSTAHKQLAVSRGHIDYLKPGQDFNNIMLLEYTNVRVANIGNCELNSQQLAFVGKKKNRTREFVILQVGLGQESYFSYPLQAHELAGDVSIEYKENTYKINSLKMPRTKHAPTLLEYYYFKVDPQAKQNQIKEQKHNQINQQIEHYRKALQEGKLDYVVVSEDRKKLKYFMEDIEIFIDQFQIGKSKTILGKQREFIDFDPARVIELYKKIKKITTGNSINID